MLSVLRRRSRKQKAIRQSRSRWAGFGQPPPSFRGELWERREPPALLRQMDSAPQELCAEASVRWPPILRASEKWSESKADRREGWRAAYPPAIGKATDVFRL